MALWMGLNVGLGATDVLQEIVVRDGDTLWKIANYYMKDPKRWPELLQYNPRLKSDPTVALSGMKLQVPVYLIKEHLRAAELVYLLKEVRYRRDGSELWKPAAVNMELYNEDSLRTMKEAKADIRFPTGEVVHLNENSLVLVRPEKAKEELFLMSGDVLANRAKVITAGGAEISPQSPDAQYRTRIKPDKSELVLVFKGNVDVTAQGKTVRIAEGFGSEIRPLSPPTQPIPLPQIPVVAEKYGDPEKKDVAIRPMSTRDGLILKVDLPSLQVESPEDQSSAPTANRDIPGAPPSSRSQAITAKNFIQRYRIQINKTKDFSSPLVDGVYPISQKLNLTKQGLADGEYWWRIAYIDSLGLEGRFSTPQSFQVDLTPPALIVASPLEGEEFSFESDEIRIEGTCEPESSVIVEEKGMTVDGQGVFKGVIYLKEGKNRLTFLARDSFGNLTTVERVVYRLGEGQEGRYAKRVEEEEDSDKPRKETTFATFGLGLLTIGVLVGVFILIIG